MSYDYELSKFNHNIGNYGIANLRLGRLNDETKNRYFREVLNGKDYDKILQISYNDVAIYYHMDNSPYGVTDIKLVKTVDLCPNGYTDAYYSGSSTFNYYLKPCIKIEYGKPKLTNIRFRNLINYNVTPFVDSQLTGKNTKIILSENDSDKNTIGSNNYLEVEYPNIGNEDLVRQEYCNMPNKFNALTPYCRTWCRNNSGKCDDSVKFSCNHKLMTKKDNIDLFNHYCSCINPKLDDSIGGVDVSKGVISVCQTDNCNKWGYQTLSQLRSPCNVVDCSIIIEGDNSGLSIGDININQICGIYNNDGGGNVDIDDNRKSNISSHVIVFIIILLLLTFIVLPIVISSSFITWKFINRII